ncbi:hypothetical protein EMIHUDRAFT_444915 [Emiliania huxleyi CCMP1516]|uniref:RING-type domain-containing protein n=2 Tax=Emiliania huxleyi TaxID=2903 RepID=A0A0D3IAE5_EMIH1|nr:hypothetical protein EMIHUDRAFT_312087 [Emiliania huxleyi CCMP1516]XP_005771711.1 hypothetical protein EMIHUDRAFT_444915 [Emiliania huxleyi CCMP1516]EOD08230.1 hypothetical protein EMIHUDRAFT_312087 [Emiliania huxleyi CCMP1516]EOD19282.1 hypothetical protein EMIHUDRAFT_444915 [Emiliania huxleyi CCMP1516]|eukprot:XP_005760659.1 hypothetical protein EMIHUDRAFT_312087 [Emiliania huxleyi CCMP1516]
MQCAVCPSSPAAMALSLPCSHVMCASCAASALGRTRRCPVCDATATSAAPAEPSASTVVIKHNGAAFTLGVVDDEPLYPLCVSVWRYPAGRVKLISRGTVLKREEARAVPGMVLQLMASSGAIEPVAIPRLRVRSAEWWEAATGFLRATWTALPARGHWLSWMWRLVSTVTLFFRSLIAPMPPPAPREGPR